LSDFNKIWHGHTTWPYKQVWARIFHLSQNSRWPQGVKWPKSTKFDPTNHISAQHLDLVHQILTEFGMDILLDLSNKLAKRISHLSLNPRWPPGVKGPKLTKFTPQITFRLGIWISFIRFGQNLAWTYFLTLHTSLCKNISVSTKYKMAAGGQRSKMTKFDPTNHISARHFDLVHQIWTKFGMNILLDPTNKFAQEFIS
jgi:hypothetical protein